MAKTLLLSLSLAFLLLFHVCSADERQTGRRPARETGRRPTRGTGRQNECEIDRLNTIEPTNKIQCEAGIIETWDHNDEQLQCAGVATIKRTIEPKGLQLPSYQNAPQLVYIIKGRGIQGTAIPGCPETYQSSQQSSEGQQDRRFQDQHQKIRYIREGDIIAIPAGVAHWCYNDGDSPLISISLLDTSNNENQLDYNPRSFYLGGNPEPEHEQQQQGRQYGQQGQQGGSCNNIFCGLSIDIIAEAFDINEETAKKIQSIDDIRKNIVKIEGGLQVIRPPRIREERGEREERGQQAGRGNDNGLEETLCTLRLKENIGDPSRADIYTPQAGRISTLNSLNLPILKWIQLSAERGILYSNAIMIPHWNVNAHSIIYGLAGRARIQIVDNYGNTVYDGEINENQILVVPQNFAVTKQAENEGFAWISFKTNDIATISTLAGRTSAIRALPQQIIAQAFQISEEAAQRIKFNREETHLIQSRQGRRSEGRAEA